MKRVTGLFAVAGLVAAFAGCGGGKPANTVVVWAAQGDCAASLQEMAADFEKETGAKVKVVQLPASSFASKVFRSFGREETEFDVVAGDRRWLGRAVTQGLYLDLTKWLPKAASPKNMSSKLVKYLCEYPAGSKKYFAAPYEPDAVGFVYRKDWFSDSAEKAAFKKKYRKTLKAPETWDDLKRVAEFFNRPADGKYGCALLTGRTQDALTTGFQQIMWAYGGSWGDGKTLKVKGKVNSAASVKALAFMKGLLEFSPRGGASLGYEGTLEAFTNGSTAVAMGYCSQFPSVVKQMGDNAGFFMVPKKGERRAVSIGGQSFSISAKIPEERADLAKQFIAWFLSSDVQKKWTANPGRFTARTKILAAKDFRRAEPYNETFAKSVDSVGDFWSLPVYEEMLVAAQKNLGEAVDGVKQPAEALNALAEAHDKILVDAGLRSAPAKKTATTKKASAKKSSTKKKSTKK
jgi:multiple sugar transport system substrate-binding protein